MGVMEMITGANSAILITPLKEIKFPHNSPVGALIKAKDRVIVPNGETTIEAGDKVVTVTIPECVPDLREILEGNRGNSATVIARGVGCAWHHPWSGDEFVLPGKYWPDFEKTSSCLLETTYN